MGASGRSAPAKPWERPGAQSNPGASPFAPSSPTTSTAAAISNSSTAIANGEKPYATTAGGSVPVADGRVMPSRPWERNQGGYGGYNGYNTSSSYNRPYGGYGSYSGNYGYGSPYGSSMYGNYGSNYGGNYGNYGGNYGNGGMYNRYGYGGYGMPPMGGYGPGNPMGPNPDDPQNGPPRAPNFWQSMLSMLHGVMTFFGRLAFLIDENTQAFHFFITALLQLCDRAGVLYGELARFVLRLLGFRPRSPKARALPGSDAVQQEGAIVPKEAPTAAWDNVWSQ